MHVILTEVDLLSEVQILIFDLDLVQDASLLVPEFHLADLLGFRAEGVPIVVELYCFSGKDFDLGGKGYLRRVVVAQTYVFLSKEVQIYL